MSYPKLHRTADGCYIARIADDVPETAKYATKIGALAALCEILHRELERAKPEPVVGCGAALARGQWWGRCGQTDMGQTAPALCTECGGEFVRA